MANTLKLEIVTPEAQAYSEDVEMVTIPAAEGEMGIYPSTRSAHGPNRRRANSSPAKTARTSSSPSVTALSKSRADRVAILTDMAMNSENIDEAKAEEARKRAEARLAESLDSAESARVQAALAQSAALLKVARRRRG